MLDVFPPMTLRDRIQLWVARHWLSYWDERLERGRNGRTEAIRLRAIRERVNVERVIAEYEATDARIGR
jgi:hypothetical protein